MSLGSNLVALRKKAGLTRVQLAEEMNIPSTTLRNYEQDDREPGHKFLVEIAKRFDVTIDYLLDNEKAPASEEAGAKENVSLEETNAVLVEMGYIRQGEQLSDADFAFLEHIGGLMDAWFSSKHP